MTWLYDIFWPLALTVWQSRGTMVLDDLMISEDLMCQVCCSWLVLACLLYLDWMISQCFDMFCLYPSTDLDVLVLYRGWVFESHAQSQCALRNWATIIELGFSRTSCRDLHPRQSVAWLCFHVLHISFVIWPSFFLASTLSAGIEFKRLQETGKSIRSLWTPRAITLTYMGLFGHDLAKPSHIAGNFRPGVSMWFKIPSMLMQSMETPKRYDSTAGRHQVKHIITI